MATVPPPRASGSAGSHPYTCNSCQVAYRNIDLQKTHMKSDWHRYNLKRRVASLPPISAEVFTEKVLQARAATSAEADKAYFERSCEICDKTYYSQNAYENHLLSQKHKQNQVAGPSRQEDETTSLVSSTFSLGEPAAVPRSNVDSDAEEEFNQVIESLQNTNVTQRPSPVKRPSHPAPKATIGELRDAAENSDSASTTITQMAKDPSWTLQSCLFCNYESPTTTLNVHHMERFHGMFIPEKKYVRDIEGLIKHLQEQIAEFHQCLSCGKATGSVYAVQTHMRDKGHCKIPYTTEYEQLAIGDFYDFRSTYSDYEDVDSDSEAESEETKLPKLGARRATKTEDAAGNDIGEEEEGDGWETDSSESSLDSADLTAVPAEGHFHHYDRLSKHPHHSSSDPRQRHQVDGWHSRAHKHTHAAFYDDYELHLPSGKSVGHRSLNKYYRQNLHNHPSQEERTEMLAIKAAEQNDGVNEENDGQIAVRNDHGRSLVPRGAAGLAGVSDEKKQRAKRSEQRGRSLEQFNNKRNDMAYGTKLNNHKSFYYRFQGGG